MVSAHGVEYARLHSYDNCLYIKVLPGMMRKRIVRVSHGGQTEMNSPQEIVRTLIDAGETQLSIERATGISQATISRIAAGVSQDPRSSTVTKLRSYADQVLQGKETAA